MYLVFPKHFMACPSGLMIGLKDEKKDILCVVAVVTPSKAKQLPSKDLAVLGLWYRFDSIIEELKLEEQPSLILFLHRGENLPKILSRCEEVVVILHDQPSTSTFLTIRPLKLRSNTIHNENGLTCGQSNVQTLLPLPEINADSCIDEIIDYTNIAQDPKVKTSIQAFDSKSHIQEHISRFMYWILLLPSFILGFFCSISSFLKPIFKPKPANYMMSVSVLFKQFSLRLTQVRATNKPAMLQPSNYMSDGHQEPRMDLKQYLQQKQREYIIKGSLITIITLDVLLGLVMVRWLTSTNIIADMASYLLQNTENVAQQLIQLIQWLMGVPAGLKLNKTLTSFLGKFFLYHIYLWQTYLKIIAPYLQTLLWMCILSGCLGITFLISLASDVLSLLTLHIYCFYVYAARLYSLQVYTLLSLARLFTGKKCNILRSRVDSLPYDVDRLFIGTLFFTVLLFLLPTTALFYVVFTSLRLLVYVVKYFLSCATHFMNKLPLFGLMLLFFRPCTLPGGLHVEILENLSNQATAPPNSEQLSSPLPQANSVLFLKLSNKPLSITQLMDWTIETGHETDEEQDTWGTFLGKLLRGYLVYPWIKRN